MIYKITFDELQTIEFIINNSPLTHIYTDSTELPLTPGQLVFSRNLNHSSLSESAVNGEIYIYGHREKLINIINHLWYRCRTEYVTIFTRVPKVKIIKQQLAIYQS